PRPPPHRPGERPYGRPIRTLRPPNDAIAPGRTVHRLVPGTPRPPPHRGRRGRDGPPGAVAVMITFVDVLEFLGVGALLAPLLAFFCVGATMLFFRAPGERFVARLTALAFGLSLLAS